MRKVYFLILVTLLAIPFAQAQYVPMLNENLVWQVEENEKESPSIFQPSITRTFNYFKGDSLINGLTYKKLMAKRFYYYKSDAWGTVNDTSIGKEFLRALFYEDISEHKVYSWPMDEQSCQEERDKVLLYDFKLQVGDTIRNIFLSFSDCFLGGYAVVDSVYLVVGQDGIQRKRLDFTGEFSNKKYSILEGIGGQGLIHPFEYDFISGGTYTETILCTKNGETKIFGDCAQVASINDFATSVNSVSIYPNPSKGLVQISSQALIESLQVFNAFGQQVLSQNPSAKQVDLATSTYAPGIYYVSVNGAALQKLAVLD